MGRRYTDEEMASMSPYQRNKILKQREQKARYRERVKQQQKKGLHLATNQEKLAKARQRQKKYMKIPQPPLKDDRPIWELLKERED